MGFIDDSQIKRSEFLQLKDGDIITFLSNGYALDFHYIEMRNNQTVKKSVAFVGVNSQAMKEGYSKRKTYYYLATISDMQSARDGVVEVKAPVIYDINDKLSEYKKHLKEAGKTDEEIKQLADKRNWSWRVKKEGTGKDTRWTAEQGDEVLSVMIDVEAANEQLGSTMEAYESFLVEQYHEVFKPAPAAPVRQAAPQTPAEVVDPNEKMDQKINIDEIPF